MKEADTKTEVKADAQPCETPWEDLRAGALREYEAASTVAHSWASVIPQAINYYFDHARVHPTPTPEAIAAVMERQKLRCQGAPVTLTREITDINTLYAAWKTSEESKLAERRNFHRYVQQLLGEAESLRTQLAISQQQFNQFVADTVEGMECLPDCDSEVHAELCPVTNPIKAFRSLHTQLADSRREVKEIQECDKCDLCEDHHAMKGTPNA